MGFKDRFENLFKSSKKEDSQFIPDDNIDLSENMDVDDSITENSSGEDKSFPENILFVCDQNDVISPIAEAIFNQRATNQNAISAGLDAPTGEYVSYNARRSCENHGIDLSAHRTRNLKDISIDEMDLVLCSSVQIRDALKMQYLNLEIFTIREYAGNYSNPDISQPLGGDFSLYENCFQEVEEAVSRIVDNFAQCSYESTQTRDFKYLDNLIHSGSNEIFLDYDIVLSDGEESEYLSGIELDVDDLVIDGQGHSIDAKRKTRIFTISSQNVVLKNISLKKGFAAGGDGGAINNQNAFLTIADSIIAENTAKSKGGAIYNGRGELSIINSLFTQNSAMESSGAIENIQGNITIIGSTFSQNSARDFAGVMDNFGGALEISDSEFFENEAKNYDGGVIRNRGSLTIEDSKFKANASKRNGGVIYNVDELTITESKFYENASKRNGGALYNDEGNLTVNNSKFDRNSSLENGGALYNKEGSISISDSIFNENSSKENGAAFLHGLGTFKVFNCEISNNESSSSIVHNQDYLQIYNTLFKSNLAENVVFNGENESILGIFYGKFQDNHVDNAIIFNNAKSCSIEKCIFENISNPNSNNIVNHGDLTLFGLKIKDEGKSILNEGYVFVKNSSPVFLSKILGKGKVEDDRPFFWQKYDFGYLYKTIQERDSNEIILDTDISFENYERDFYEGGIELDADDLVIDGNGITIDGAGKSRIFLVSGNNITLKNITFKNGCSHKNYDCPYNDHGGAIKVVNNVKLTLDNCKFINNESNGSGGAIHDRHGELTVHESEFDENTAENGGAIFCGGDLAMSYSQLLENSSKQNGGAIFNNGDLAIYDSKINRNTADNGGAIYNFEGTVNVLDSVFNENASNREGGSIRNVLGTLSISKSSFNVNKGGNGGAINNSGVSRMFESACYGNVAGDGGVAYNSGSFTFSSCILNENVSNVSGGAIENLGGDLEIFESTLKENSAHSAGGAIDNDRGSLSISESVLNENSSKWGGAIVNQGELSITESIFEKNVADTYGGALSNSEGASLEISDSTFNENIAKGVGNFGDGGAILNWSRLKPKITDCTFNHNEPNDVFERLQ